MTQAKAPGNLIYLDRYQTQSAPLSQGEGAIDYENGLEMDWTSPEGFDPSTDANPYEDLTQGSRGDGVSDDELFDDLFDQGLEASQEGEELANGEVAPDEVELQWFREDIQEAENQFKEFVQANPVLSEEEKDEIILSFKAKTKVLSGKDGIEAAQEKLNLLIEEARAGVEEKAEESQEAKEAKRKELFDIITQATQDPLFREAKSHWHHVGWSLGEQFDTALQTGDWTEFQVSVEGLTEGDQRFVPIMRLVSAIYRTAGNKEKATEIINHFMPKEAVQKLIAKVTSAADNLHWTGQGWPDNQDQVGSDKWHLWTPSGTAEFLRDTLAARRESDPYEPMTYGELD